MRTYFSRLFYNLKKSSLQRAATLSRQRRRSQVRSRLLLEPLEDRRLMASDLSITKTGPVGSVAAGSAVSYTVVVNNAGPDAATASVVDTLPSSISGATFTSSATGGATGNTTSGTGNLSNSLTLPAGSSVTYTVTGNVVPTATGTLSNTATVAATGTTV